MTQEPLTAKDPSPAAQQSQIADTTSPLDRLNPAMMPPDGACSVEPTIVVADIFRHHGGDAATLSRTGISRPD